MRKKNTIYVSIEIYIESLPGKREEYQTIGGLVFEGGGAGGRRREVKSDASSGLSSGYGSERDSFSEAFAGVELALGRVKDLGEVAGGGLGLRREGTGDGAAAASETRRGGERRTSVFISFDLSCARVRATGVRFRMVAHLKDLNSTI